MAMSSSLHGRGSHGDRAADAMNDAADKTARTKATTVAGASAFLKYVTFENVPGLFMAGEYDWHQTAFKSLKTALAKIARSQGS
jgi:hypothetical protein